MVWYQHLVLAFATMFASAALAQGGSPGRVLQPFNACRSIEAREARLACFEKALAQLEADVRAKEIVIISKADAASARQSTFGLTQQRIDRAQRNGAPEPFKDIDTTIASARTLANDFVEIRLADDSNAVWRTTDPVQFPPRPGAKIRISRGAFGSYFITIQGRSYRAIRVR